MTKSAVRKTMLVVSAVAALIGPAEARGFGGSHGFRGGSSGSFSGRNIAIGEPHPGSHGHGGFGHRGWGSRRFGWGFGTVGFVPYYGDDFCFTKRYVDPFGNLVVRRVCD